MIIRDALKFFIPAVLLSLFFTMVTLFSDLFIFRFLIFLCAAAALFILYFFRNPERPLLAAENEIVSPADGKIVYIGNTEDEDMGKCQLLSVFMSVLNVHVNRSPISGVVKKKTYKPGRFLAAFKENTRFDNEQISMILQNENLTIKVTQVAGILARRIVNWMNEEDQVSKGARIGLIKFGSRVDVYFPEKIKLSVKTGDRVIAGVSVIGVTDAN